MIDLKDSFSIDLGIAQYLISKEKHSNSIPWSKLSNDTKELYIVRGIWKHRQQLKEKEIADSIRRGNDHKE